MGQRNGKLTSKSFLETNEKLSESVAVNRTMSAAVLHEVRTRKHRQRSSLPGANEDVTDIPMFLTREQKRIIRGSFDSMKLIIADVGVIFFMRLFETHPEVQSAFPPFNGQSQDDLRHSHKLRNHGLRVMGFVEKCVARLDQPEKLVALCLDLGLRHKKYQIPVSYLPLVPPQFIYAIKPSLKEWNYDIERAWQTLFHIVLFYMRQAMTMPVESSHPENHPASSSTSSSTPPINRGSE